MQLRAFTLIAETYKRAGKPEQALSTMRQALQFFRESKAPIPDHLRNQAEIRAIGLFTSLGEFAEAEAVASSISDPSYLPHVLFTLASGQARWGNTAAAFATAARINSPDRDSTYRSIAEACFMIRRDFACARQAAQAMTDSPIKVRLLGQIADAEVHRNTGGAAQNLQDAQWIAENLPEAEKYEFGGWFVGCPRPTQESQRDSALRELAGAQSATGDFSAARNSLRAIRDQEGRENALVSIATNAADRRVFGLALSFAGEISDPRCQSVALAAIAVIQHRAGEADAARHTLQQIPEIGQRVRALVTIADGQFSRQREAAINTLALAALAAQQVSDPAERFDALAEVITRQLAAGLREQALACLFTARAIAEVEAPKKDRQHNWQTSFIRLAGWFAQAGNLQAAIESARRVDPFFTPPAMYVAGGMARAGNAQAARSWAATLPTADERTFALIGIAAGILNSARIRPHSQPF